MSSALRACARSLGFLIGYIHGFGCHAFVLGDEYLPADDLAQLLDEYKDDIEQEVCFFKFFYITCNY